MPRRPFPVRLRRPVRLGPARLVALVLVLAAATLGGALTTLSPAAAAGRVCHQEAVKNPDGTISYVQVCHSTGPGDPGDPGGGGPEDCGQDQVKPGPGDGAYFCSGGIPCAYTTNVVPLALPTTDPPAGQEWQVLICDHGGFFTKDWVLTGGNQPRPLIVQALEAYGNLAPPAGRVRHSPDGRALVELPTWLWLDPGSFGRLEGSSAEGLLAVAEPAGTVWSPGDGSSVACRGPGVPYGAGAAESSACTHTYHRASARYYGSVRRTWTVHYENNGARIDIPGAPVELTADSGFALTVVESQVVTGGR